MRFFPRTFFAIPTFLILKIAAMGKAAQPGA
jgi:hypothetical protein